MISPSLADYAVLHYGPGVVRPDEDPRRLLRRRRRLPRLVDELVGQLGQLGEPPGVVNGYESISDILAY